MRYTRAGSDYAQGWTNEAPHEAPFATSRHISGLARTGRFVSYTNADTWYPSWGADDRLYSPYTDGYVNGLNSDSFGPGATTGCAVISGADPVDLQIVAGPLVAATPGRYTGRYPSASLMHDGVWYYGTYCVDDSGRGLNLDTIGPFVGFRTSTDAGATWREGPHTPERTIFGEGADGDTAVRLTSPHFVDFGRNNEFAPGGYAYLVGHGGRVPSARLNWISGDEVTLGRVRPGIDAINDPAAWEWAAGRDADGGARWVRSLADAVPIAVWPGHMGCTTITWIQQLGRYLMCVTDGWPTIKRMNSYVLEAESLLGPWRMAAYLDCFGEQGYFLNFPSKFVASDGSRAWLCYSANFTNGYLGTTWRSDPEGSRYGMCLQEVTIQGS